MRTRAAGPKTLIYLDHNFVSNLAKARLGRIRDSRQQEYYVQLLELLETLVLKDRIICPRSASHELEAELDGRVEGEILLTIGSLARGVAFLDDTQVVTNQVTNALYNYLGKHFPERIPWWAEAFEEDPHAPVLRDLPNVEARVRVPGRPERARWLKKRFVEEVEGVRRRFGMQPRTFDLQLRQETVSLAAAYCFEPFLESQLAYEALLTGRKWDLRALFGARHVYDLHRHYEDLTGDQSYDFDARFWQFFHSNEFASVPYVDIFCSVNAASRVHFPDRQTRESDLYDVCAIATALPYCDILATDAYMKSLIHQVGLDTEYGVEVFSARKGDLIAFFDRLAALAWVRA